MNKEITVPSGFEWLSLEDPTYRNALEQILFGIDNLNIIGSAGMGKSSLLKVATRMLSDMGHNVVLLSPTGIAAVNISSEGIPATTIHSFFKLPPLDLHPLESAIANHALTNKVRKVDTFIIDETSMVSSAFFDYLVYLLLSYHNGSKAQLPRLILFSDILQLPPVIPTDNPDVNRFYQTNYQGKRFFFNSFKFESLEFKTIILKHIYRQKDGDFQGILNRIRLGTQTNNDLSTINSYVMEEASFHKQNNLYMNLNTTNAAVHAINEAYLGTFKGKAQTYYANVDGAFKLPVNSPLQREVTIKPETQIMCLKNNAEAGYQNGTLGKVLEVYPKYVDVELDTGDIAEVGYGEWQQFNYTVSGDKIEPKQEGSFKQISCKIAASITVHKAQGQTFSALYFDKGKKVFAESLIYVALSRLRDLKGLGLMQRIQHSDVKVSREALEFLETV